MKKLRKILAEEGLTAGLDEWKKYPRDPTDASAWEAAGWAPYEWDDGFWFKNRTLVFVNPL